MKSDSTVRPELLSLTYGAIVADTIKTYSGDIPLINTKLTELGVRVGEKMADEFLAFGSNEPCANIKDLSEKVIKGLKYYLNVGNVESVLDKKSNAFLLHFTENPLTQFVTLPEGLSGLSYSNLIVGAIRGALKSVDVNSDCEMTRDRLKGDYNYEVRVRVRPTDTADLRNFQE